MKILTISNKHFISNNKNILPYHYFNMNNIYISNKDIDSKKEFSYKIRSLNITYLYFKRGEIRIFDEKVSRALMTPIANLKYPSYIFKLKSFNMVKEWDKELSKIEKDDFESRKISIYKDSIILKKAFSIEDKKEFKLFIYSKVNTIGNKYMPLREISKKLKKNILKNKLENINKQGLFKNLINPYYYFPPQYNRKSMLSQLRHWNTSIYTFVKRDKRMNVHLDIYANKLIKSFFSVKSTWLFTRSVNEILSNMKISPFLNRKNNSMFLYTYNLLLFPEKVKRNIANLLKDKWLSNQIEYYKFMLEQKITSVFGLDLNFIKDNYVRKRSRWMLGKPLFKHTSFNVIIDLFIFNNKTSYYNKLQNLLTRRILYKYMYSMYVNFAGKIKATYSRPRFFYMNILEPNTSAYYHKVIRNYEKTIIFKNGIFKLYLYYYFINMKYYTWKKKLSIKYNIFGAKDIFEMKNNNKESVSLKSELIIDNNSSKIEEDYVLLKKEEINIINLHNKDNKWIKNENDKKQIAEREVVIKSWWEVQNERAEVLAKKARTRELLYKKHLKLKLNKENRNLDSLDNMVSDELTDNSMEDKTKKGKKRKKQDEYKNWLKNFKSKSDSNIVEKNNLNIVKNQISISRELLDNKSISWEQIEDEYYKQHPEQGNKWYIRTGEDENNLKNDSLTKKESEKEKIINEQELNKDKVNVQLDKKEEIEPSEFWNSSLFNISMINILNKTKTENNKLPGMDNDDKRINSEINTFTNYYKFPLESYKNLDFFNPKLSINTLMNEEEDFISDIREKLQSKLLKIKKKTKSRRRLAKLAMLLRKINSSAKNINLNFKNIRREIQSNFHVSHIDQNKNLKALWEKKDYKFFNVLYLLFNHLSNWELKEGKGKKISNKLFYSLYNDTKLFKGYGNFWYWFYFSAYTKKEFYLISRDVLVFKRWNILPKNDNYTFSLFSSDINIPYNHYIKSNYGQEMGHFWPSYHINQNKNDNNSLLYNEEMFKPYYRYMIPLFIVKSFIQLCVRIKDYSLSYVSNLFLWDSKIIESRAVLVSRFILVKILLDLLQYNYRSFIRLKPKYYFLNRVRRIKQKYLKASRNHWISNNRLLDIGRKAPKLFWYRYEKLMHYYYSYIVKNAELDTRRKIFVPFVIYIEDLLYAIYGKWVLIRLWPLKRFFLSSYILANRVLMLVLWRNKGKKNAQSFTRRALTLMTIFRLKEIKSYYSHYMLENNSWPTSMLKELKKDVKINSLNLSNLESYSLDWDMSDRLNIYSRPDKNLHSYFSSVRYNYKNEFFVYLSKDIEMNQKWMNKIRNFNIKLKNTEIKYMIRDWRKRSSLSELSYYWLRPFNFYLLKLRKRFDISGIRFKLSGRLGHARSNDRSTYKHIYSGNFFGPRHTNKLLKKKIPLNVFHIRGHIKSYIDYSRSESKTRSGAVSLKVWLYSRFSADIQELLLHLMEIKQLYDFLMNKSYEVEKRVKDVKRSSFVKLESLKSKSKSKLELVKLKDKNRLRIKKIMKKK